MRRNISCWVNVARSCPQLPVTIVGSYARANFMTETQPTDAWTRLRYNDGYGK